ncbi:MAG TPA: hypothetical protein VJ981_08920 [Gammaproteobacteria bacterium]|nr:hypothetical protein [Gammaproteobacteria bacterium]
MRGFRKINTVRGTYFVVWRPKDVSSLIESERLSPAELFPGNDSRRHHFIRELYLLACKASVNAMSDKTASDHRLLSRYARILHDHSLNK